ncbi:RNA 3'-terminal phosphate cyclase [Sparassis latifolia]
MATTLIDGRVLEGGGQLLRNAVALAALLARPISIDKIRQNRGSPGLKHQHATGLRLVADICSADLSGCTVGSDAISFRPGPIQLFRHYTADTKTAGSIALLLQIALPCLLFSHTPSSGPTELTLRGGTNALQAPQLDYTMRVFLPFLQRHFGLQPQLRVRTRGFYPKGGGEVYLSVPPVRGPLPPVELIERGSLSTVAGRAYVAGLPERVAEAMRDAAVQTLVSSGVDPGVIDISSVREKRSESVGSGSGIVLWAETSGGCVLGGSAVGQKRRDPATVGREAAEELVRNLEHGGCVDEHMQDQMIIFLALARGRSTVRTGPLTLHTRTAIWIAEHLTEAKFEIEEPRGVIIRCDGIGYTSDDFQQPSNHPPPSPSSAIP